MPLIKTKNSQGFTAVEIAMVASVIAILALLVIPIFRKRAEEARVAAVHDEMSSMVKVLLLVEADMPGGDYLVQLNDLDNPSFIDNPSAIIEESPELEPPRYKWDRVTESFLRLTEAQYFNSTVPNWRGPYLANPQGFERSKSVSMYELNVTPTYQVFLNKPGYFGAITIPGDPYDNNDLIADRYPVDPWGTPYLLWGPSETVYNSRVLYSLGPNGVPGSLPSPSPQDYGRRNAVLGTGDDLEFKF